MAEQSKLSIEREHVVKVSQQQAFDIFVKHFSKWWPKEYSWGRDCLEFIGIEPKAGGRCFERGPHGFECQFGRVLTYNPPEEISFTWQINDKGQPDPNPKNASIIKVKFIAIEPTHTKLILNHHSIENHGENAKKYCEELNSDYGWSFILKNFIETVHKI
ncbi:MAG: ATPase [Gammaproteobacteria bacterium]|jgi:uncharacterized protein YndB with AHSA1/START domain|nr:ATPase [Gammaproteobacteria bacterium]